MSPSGELGLLRRAQLSLGRSGVPWMPVRGWSIPPLHLRARKSRQESKAVPHLHHLTTRMGGPHGLPLQLR